MATSFMETKKVTLSQVVEDLKSGMTKWKKDDIGFGSIEKKYNLQMNEAIKLFNHSKIVLLEHTIPTFVIIDDLPEEQSTIDQAPEAPAPAATTIPEPIQVQAQAEVRLKGSTVAQQVALDRLYKLSEPKATQQVKTNLEVAF